MVLEIIEENDEIYVCGLKSLNKGSSMSALPSSNFFNEDKCAVGALTASIARSSDSWKSNLAYPELKLKERVNIRYTDQSKINAFKTIGDLPVRSKFTALNAGSFSPPPYIEKVNYPITSSSNETGSPAWSIRPKNCLSKIMAIIALVFAGLAMVTAVAAGIFFSAGLVTWVLPLGFTSTALSISSLIFALISIKTG